MNFKKIAARLASNYKRQHFKCKGYKWKVPDMLAYIEEKQIPVQMYPVAPLYERVSTSPEGYFDEPFRSEEFMERAMESNYEEYPIIVWNLPDKVRISDGNHRVVKAHEDGVEEIPAYVLSEEDIWSIPHEKVEESSKKK